MTSEIANTLEKWYNVKQEIALLEKRQERYKKEITNYLNHKESDKINTKYFEVTRRHNARESVSKKDIPEDLWKRVCSRSTYSSLILKKK